MFKKKLILLGSGGHAKAVIDVCHALNITVDGILCENGKLNELFFNTPIIGDDNILDEPEFIENNTFHVGIAKINIRKKLLNKLSNINASMQTIIHPSSIVSKFSEIGDGSFLAVNTIVAPSTNIGDNVIVNTASIIEHDVSIGNNSHIGPSVTLCGYVKCGENVFIGCGANILPEISIGNNVIIGAGSVVTKNIPENTTFAGSPAKQF